VEEQTLFANNHKKSKVGLTSSGGAAGS